MSYAKIVGTTYEDFGIYVTDKTIMIYPLDGDSLDVAAFKINESTARLLQDAANIVRERLTAAT